jgi:exonuclease SbcC
LKCGQQPGIEASLQRWREELEQSPALSEELEVIQQELFGCREEREKLARCVAVTEAQLEQLHERLKELAERKAEVTMVRAELEDYTFLAEAFGKKGIQAVIIENAIPELESEANRILSRLTENKMHVALVTQQRTKSGGMLETLDLLIGDEIGTRNYELFSGGEAFKVNFAIRVALSRLLARRAGAKLETLIIDEGFGSQDDSSRERLARSIRSVQGEFAKILVITHMPDVREMFPVQILVRKAQGLSSFELVS